MGVTNAEAHQILEQFHPTYVQHLPTMIEEVCQCDTRLDSTASAAANFKEICGYYYQQLQVADNLPPPLVPEQRSANIRLVNHAQYKFLRKKRKLTDERAAKLNENHRFLIPYFRKPHGRVRGDVDPFQFGISVFTINKLIEEHRTSIFDGVRCVSLYPGEFPEYLIDIYGQKIYYPCRGEQFREFCAIGNSSIHFAHGSPKEQTDLGSPPLVGTSVRKDKQRMKAVRGKVVPLYLDYDQNNCRIGAEDKLSQERYFAGSISGVMTETIRAVVELEFYLLKGAKKGKVFTNPSPIFPRIFSLLSRF